eukprot:TRINITY_DN2109_c0_g2_i7.p1 TRINITY_DN2109_c0_g2~~TRINITY_DN2109_c0_g2_i7.p1  ORF type:complete len:105 (+),score=18.68 TRINITY_DN2109_c0_g2_i7:262-576(+)
MKIHVHVREKVIAVECGTGVQPIKWLGSVGIARYDSSQGITLGSATDIRIEDQALDMNGMINQTLQDGDHVWVVLKGDEQYGKMGYTLQDTMSFENGDHQDESN